MKHAAALFCLLLALWLFNSGHYTILITSFGVASCLLVVLLARRMGIVDAEALPIHLLSRLPRYLPWIVKEVVPAEEPTIRISLASVATIGRFHPRLPNRPAFHSNRRVVPEHAPNPA